MTKQSHLLRIDNAIKELEEVREQLRAEARAAESGSFSAQGALSDAVVTYQEAYEEYAAAVARDCADDPLLPDLRAEASRVCNGCYFDGPVAAQCRRTEQQKSIYPCMPSRRRDGRSVIWVAA
jgi:hypothetical protein